jgi:hypothetical protein
MRPQQLFVTIRDIGPGAGSATDEGQPAAGGAPRPDVFRECFTHHRRHGLAGAPRLSLKIPFKRFGQEDGRPFHITYASIRPSLFCGAVNACMTICLPAGHAR